MKTRGTEEMREKRKRGKRMRRKGKGEREEVKEENEEEGEKGWGKRMRRKLWKRADGGGERGRGG